MAFLTKLALVFIVISIFGAPITYASSLHQREKQNLMGFADCVSGFRKLGRWACENGGGSTNIDRTAWSQSLRTALSPPPAPVKRLPKRSSGTN